MNNLRVAWLLPTAWFYWQPVMSEFTKLFPHTKVFTALFPGFVKGLENSLSIEIIGQQIKLQSKTETTSYGSTFTYLSPSVIRQLLKFKPQIIFSSSFGVWTILALLFKPLGRWKVIIAYEGSSPSVDYRNSWIRLAIRRLMVKIADACISNSQSGREYLVNCLKAKPELTFAQPYEVPDLNSWSELMVDNEQQINHFKQPVFLFVGRIIPRKGLHLLLEACLLLKKQGIEEYTILIIGDGSQKAELETLCQQYQIEERFQWLGKVDYSKLGSYFQLADVFVLPTLEDTWGMVILEAMLCGKPILCSTGAGASELVQEGKNGYCFLTNDVETLAKAINNFIKNPSLPVAMGNKSRQIISQHTPANAAIFLNKMVNLVI